MQNKIIDFQAKRAARAVASDPRSPRDASDAASVSRKPAPHRAELNLPYAALGLNHSQESVGRGIDATILQFDHFRNR